MDQEERWKPNSAPSHPENCQDSEVRQVYALAFATPGTRDIVRKALQQDEQYTWAKNKHDKGMAIQPIAQPAKIGATAILVDRQYPNVAMTAVAEVPATGVMPRMISAPQVVRRQCEQSAETTQEVIRSAASKERVMPAIVLDDEDPHEETGRRDCQEKREPIGPRNAQVH